MDHLRVSGQSMTPRLDSGVCSSASMTRENEDDDEDEMEFGTQMQTVVDMNNALEKRVEALRLRIRVQEKHNEAEREQIFDDKNKTLHEKNTEIKILHGKLNDKDAELSYEENRTEH